MNEDSLVSLEIRAMKFNSEGGEYILNMAASCLICNFCGFCILIIFFESADHIYVFGVTQLS